MDREFLKEFLEKTMFPDEAGRAYMAALDTVEKSGRSFDPAIEEFYKDGFSIENAERRIKTLESQTGVNEFTLWGVFLALASKRARVDYIERGISEEIFWDTFADMKYKTKECREIKGVWGNFVAFWYPIFYRCDIVKLGRLEYENEVYQGETYEKAGFRLQRGDGIKNIHIPSSGEPFDLNARVESYKKAYRFFKPEGGILCCQCHSWLLFPKWKEILTKNGNILSFQRDFDIISSEEEDEFADCWRLFGADYEKPLEEYPEKTSMQRDVKKYLLSGGKTGEGFGILLFDGERII